MDPNARSTAVCPHCGHENIPNARYCNDCGRPLAERCPHCESENPPGSRFCNNCGRSLRQSASPPRDPETNQDLSHSVEPPRTEAEGTPSAVCPRCNARNEPDSLYCYNCGLPLRGEPGFRGGPSATQVGIPAFALGEPGGFWLRFVAYIIDSIVMTGVLVFAVPAFLGIDFLTYMEQAAAGQVHPIDVILRVGYATILVALFATTVGKRVFRLYVVSVDGSRVGLGRALGRALGEILSSLLFGIGYLIIAFRADKRGLHDLIAGTVVIRRQ